MNNSVYYLHFFNISSKRTSLGAEVILKTFQKDFLRKSSIFQGENFQEFSMRFFKFFSPEKWHKNTSYFQ